MFILPGSVHVLEHLWIIFYFRLEVENMDGKRIPGNFLSWLSKSLTNGNSGAGQSKSPHNFKDGRKKYINNIPNSQNIKFSPYDSIPEILEKIINHLNKQSNPVTESNLLNLLHEELKHIPFPNDDPWKLSESTIGMPNDLFTTEFVDQIIPHLESLDQDQLKQFIDDLNSVIGKTTDHHTEFNNNGLTAEPGPDDSWSIDADTQADRYESYFSDPAQDAYDAVDGLDLFTEVNDQHDDIDANQNIDLEIDGPSGHPAD